MCAPAYDSCVKCTTLLATDDATHLKTKQTAGHQNPTKRSRIGTMITQNRTCPRAFATGFRYPQAASILSFTCGRSPRSLQPRSLAARRGSKPQRFSRRRFYDQPLDGRRIKYITTATAHRFSTNRAGITFDGPLQIPDSVCRRTREAQENGGGGLPIKAPSVRPVRDEALYSSLYLVAAHPGRIPQRQWSWQDSKRRFHRDRRPLA